MSSLCAHLFMITSKTTQQEISSNLFDRLICQLFSIFKEFIFQPSCNKELKKEVSPEYIIMNILEEERE